MEALPEIFENHALSDGIYSSLTLTNDAKYLPPPCLINPTAWTSSTPNHRITFNNAWKCEQFWHECGQTKNGSCLSVSFFNFSRDDILDDNLIPQEEGKTEADFETKLAASTNKKIQVARPEETASNFDSYQRWNLLLFYWLWEKFFPKIPVFKNGLYNLVTRDCKRLECNMSHQCSQQFNCCDTFC